MLIKTLLNKVERFKSFIYGDSKLMTVGGNEALVIDIKPRKNSKPECPDCVVADLCRYGAKTGPAEMIAARAAVSGAGALANPPSARRAGGRTPRAPEKARISSRCGRLPRPS